MRNIRFTFLCNEIERQLLFTVARRLQRSQGDTLRILIYRAADELGVDDKVGLERVDKRLNKAIELFS